MVYPGRPSRGCSKCIARRVKCDEGKPECERCRKRDQPCPGYRDPNDFNFIHKRKRKPKALQSVSQVALANSILSDSNDDVSDSQTYHVSRRTRSKMPASNVLGEMLHQDPPTTASLSLLDRPMSRNWEEQATCFFFHRYTLKESHNDNPGWLDFLPELYQQSELESALICSIRAVSFASLSSASSVKNLATKGHESYGMALKLVNSSLKEPDKALQDSLIVAVLLLALYENFYRERPAILMEHAKGLLTLFVLRGADQFRTSRGWAIFRQVHTHMQARSLELKEQPAPETVRWMQKMNKSFPAARSAWCTFRITQISASAAEHLSSDPSKQTVREGLHSLLHEAQDVDFEYSQWQDGADPRWGFQAWSLDADQPVEVTWADTRSNRRSSDMPEGNSQRTSPAQHILTYTNFWFSNIWNGYRSTRCVLHELILRIARHLRIRTWPTGNISTSTSVLEELLHETCASIPYTIGDVQVDAAGNLQLTPLDDLLNRQGSAAGAYFLLWPLYRVVVCPLATALQVKLATETLRRIGHKLGIRLAFALAARGREIGFGSPTSGLVCQSTQ